MNTFFTVLHLFWIQSEVTEIEESHMLRYSSACQEVCGRHYCREELYLGKHSITFWDYMMIRISHFHVYKIGILAVSTLYGIGRIDGDV